MLGKHLAKIPCRINGFHDVQGWLEDSLDDLDMRESKKKLLEVCDELIGLFRWEEEKPSDIRFLFFPAALY